MIPQTSALPVLAARRVRKTMWSRLRTVFFDSYRPELHYMRGPGPKWREKRDPLHLAGIQVTPIPRCRAAQGKLARKFLLEWLPSGLATFTIGAVLQHLLSPYILAPTEPRISQKTEIVAPELASAAIVQPVEAAQATTGSNSPEISGGTAAPSISQRTEVAAPVSPPAAIAPTVQRRVHTTARPNPAGVATTPSAQAEADKARQRSRAARKRPHDAIPARDPAPQEGTIARIPPGPAPAPQKPIIVAANPAYIEDSTYSPTLIAPEPFSIAEFDQKLQSRLANAPQSPPCNDASGRFPSIRCGMRAADGSRERPAQ
jgi:hypothetical protein